jgi:hypothetical protein
MRIYSLNPDSTTEKTAIMHALSKGYTFKLSDQDGTATVINSKGEVHNITDWQCDCQDSFIREGGSYTLGNTDRQVCKHVLWLSQLSPCPECKGYAMLHLDTWKHFGSCTPGCSHLIAFQMVKNQRQQAYRLQEQQADTIKTHTPQDVDTILTRAEEASQAIFSDEPTPKPKFTSRHGIYYTQDGDMWKVYCVGFLDSTHGTQIQAEERATRLEVLEASHANRRTRANFA